MEKQREEMENREITQNNEEAKIECIGIAKRAKALLNFLFFGFALVIFGIISLQFFGGSGKLRKEAMGTNYKLVDVPARRGDILSANGNVISSSVKKYRVYMDLRTSQLSDEVYNANVKALADSLSALFKDTSPAGYRERLHKWRKQQHGNKLISPPGVLIDYNELMRLKKFPILDRHPNNGGAKEQHQYVRMNYYGSLAQRTIGRVETENAKGYGIELSFDKPLKGIDGKSYQRKISGSFWMPVESGDDVDPVDGYDVLTTIDANIQDAAESSLRNSIDVNHAISGTAVVMEVETGKICAMVNLGRNKRGEIIEDYNHAIADNVEPGSTYKLVSLLILLENTDMTIESMIDTKKGREYVNGMWVNDSDRGGLGLISLKTAMSKSSNIGFALAVDSKYRGKAHEYIRKVHELGITKDFKFQISGETKPFIKSDSARSWSKTDLVAMSYGYVTRFTPMRILMLYNAVANGGKMLAPIVVSEIRKNGRTIESYEAEVLNQSICSSKTLKQAREALEDVMFDGTVRQLFRGESYVVAGKTGTARQVGPSGKYDNKEGVYYLASFVGYFPANDPKYSCIVQVKTLKPYGVARPYYGVALAAPVFKDISHYVSSTSDWGGKARRYAAEKELELAKRKEAEAVLNNKTAPKRSALANESEEKIDYTQFPVKVYGDEEYIDFLKRKFDLEDYTLNNARKESDKDEEELADNKMPNVLGLGLSEALMRLEPLGLTVMVRGKGRVVKQSIAYGANIGKGYRVNLVLSI